MRILHVVPYFPPDRIGGVGEVASYLHRGLLDAGHESHVVTAGFSADDPSVERIARTPLGWSVKVALLATRARRFDVVHCHQGEALSLLLALRLLRVRTPVVTTFHVSFAEFASAHRPYEIEGRRFGAGWTNRRYRFVVVPFHRVTDRFALGLADGASFISRSSARDVLGRTAGDAARVIYNGLPPLDPSDPPPGDPVREGILFVGSPSDRKRSSVLPFVLRRVHERMPAVRLSVVGIEPSEAPRLKDLFDELGQTDHVRWVGRLNASEITALYRGARVVVVPSASEGLPMVILEALRCGTPCVVTRVSGHPEVIQDGVNGFLVALDQPTEMADRCLALLSDPALAEHMGEAGRLLVASRFALTRQVEEYLALYESLLSTAEGTLRDT